MVTKATVEPRHFGLQLAYGWPTVLQLYEAERELGTLALQSGGYGQRHKMTYSLNEASMNYVPESNFQSVKKVSRLEAGRPVLPCMYVTYHHGTNKQTGYTVSPVWRSIMILIPVISKYLPSSKWPSMEEI